MESLVGKKVTVGFEEIQQSSLEGEVLAHDEKGILLKTIYRRNVRVEFIPAAKIKSLYHDEKKPRKSATKPVIPVVEVPAVTVKTADKISPEAVNQLKETKVQDKSRELEFEEEGPTLDNLSSDDDDEWGDD